MQIVLVQITFYTGRIFRYFIKSNDRIECFPYNFNYKAFIRIFLNQVIFSVMLYELSYIHQCFFTGFFTGTKKCICNYQSIHTLLCFSDIRHVR